MNILAIDSSSKAASCAFLEEDILLGEFFTNAGITHSQTILPMVDDLLKNCRRSIGDVNILALSAGPGSYTGLRIGMAVVKGLAFSDNLPCASVSTLEGLAYNMVTRPGIIAAVMDARRQQVYTALFSSNGENLTRLCEDTAITITELSARLMSVEGGENAVLVGDGALICKEVLLELPKLTLAPQALLHQRASSICALAKELVAAGKLVSSEELEPIYLRLPQAQRELEEKIKNN